MEVKHPEGCEVFTDILGSKQGKASKEPEWRESQAMKGIRRMPWRSATTKDAVSCEKTWGAASRHRSMYLRMGQPGIRKDVIVRRETRGTETSKYPEEKKSTETPSVAASERGRAQTRGLRASGVADPHKGKAP